MKVYLPVLTTSEQELIATLLVHHVNSIGPSGENNPLDKLAERIACHLERHGILNGVNPLPIAPNHENPDRSRMMLHWTDAETTTDNLTR